MQSKIYSVTFIATMLLLVLSISSFSQTSKFSISVNSLTTNFNYGRSNSQLQPYKKNFKGLQIGASCESGVSSTFSIVKELYFTIKGGTLQENNPLTISKSKLRLYTIDAPILARFHFNNLYINAGPYAAYTLGGNIKSEGSGTIPEKSTKISFGDFRRWDFGAQAGAGYNFNMKKNVLSLDVRYGYGFKNITKNVEHYNRMLSISLLVSRPSKKK